MPIQLFVTSTNFLTSTSCLLSHVLLVCCRSPVPMSPLCITLQSKCLGTNWELPVRSFLFAGWVWAVLIPYVLFFLTPALTYTTVSFQAKNDLGDLEDDTDTESGTGTSLTSEPGSEPPIEPMNAAGNCPGVEPVNTAGSKSKMIWSRASFDWKLFQDLWAATHRVNSLAVPAIRTPGDSDLKRKHAFHDSSAAKRRASYE